MCGRVTQKGLSHLHIVLIFKDKDKPRSPQIVDRIVSAVNTSQLYQIITLQNIHGLGGILINDGSPGHAWTESGL